MTGVLQNNLPHHQIIKPSKLAGGTAKRSSSILDRPIGVRSVGLNSKKRIKGLEISRSASVSQESEDVDQSRKNYTSLSYEIAEIYSPVLRQIATSDDGSVRISPPVISSGMQKVGNPLY